MFYIDMCKYSEATVCVYNYVVVRLNTLHRKQGREVNARPLFVALLFKSSKLQHFESIAEEKVVK